MNFKKIIENIRHIIVMGIAWVAGSLFITGCSSVSMPAYDPSIIAEQSQKQSAPIWVTPALSVLKSADRSQGLTGLSKPGDVPSYLGFMEEVEPPFVVDMQILADGSLLYISPLEMQRDFNKFVFANYAREVFTRVKVVLVDSKNGMEKWSRVLDAKGIYNINEIDSTLLFHSKAFDKDGKFAEGQMVALEKNSGKVKWQRKFTTPFLYFNILEKYDQILFMTETGSDKAKQRVVEGVNLATGKTSFKSAVEEEADGEKQVNNIWPIHFSDSIMLFEKGMTLYKLPQYKMLWSIKDIDFTGSVQPAEYDGTVYFQTKAGVAALDASSGKKIWTNNTITEKLTKIFRTEDHLYVTTAKEGWFSQTHMLSMIDPLNGKVLWQRETGSILGNLVDNKKAVFFSTKDELVALDLKNGEALFDNRLPWEDEFSSHRVTLQKQNITVVNEWNAAMWDANGGKLIYHHTFEPLCPIMTTQERMLEQKALGRPVSGVNVTAYTYNYPSRRAEYTAKYNQAMSNYHRTGDTLYLSDAYSNYGMTRHAMGQERVMAGIQQSGALIQATMSSAVSIQQQKILTAQQMVYPAIDDILNKQRAFDNAEYIVRLVGVEKGIQRFSALEVLNLASGETTQNMLSPYQMPNTLKTIGSSSITATEIDGYLPVSVFQYHHFMTVPDLKNRRLYHYGPGLQADEYVPFGNQGFIRGRLWAFPLALPHEQ